MERTMDRAVRAADAPTARIPVWLISALIAVAGGVVGVYAAHASRISVLESEARRAEKDRAESLVALKEVADAVAEVKIIVTELRAERRATP